MGSENQPITTVLQKDNFAEPGRQERTFICSLASLTSPPLWKWSEEFVKEVRRAGEKDEEYQKTMKELEEVLGKMALNDGKVTEEATRPREVQYRDQKVRSEEVLKIKDGLLY